MNRLTQNTENEFDFKEIFDSLPESIIVLDTSFRVLNMNDNAETKFRISRNKAYGKPPNTFLPEEVEAIARKALEEERTIFGDEIQPVLRGGEKSPIQAVASPLFNDSGSIKGILLQIKDLEGSKFLSSKKIQEVSASKFENLILGLAHELKNPLSGIRGAAQLLAGDTENTEIINCAGIIIKEADRLKALLDSLKHLEPSPKEVFEPFDMHEVLMEIVQLESMSSCAADIHYKQDYDVTLPPLVGDRNALKQVFLNLIKNASQAINGEGQVEISTRWKTDHKLKNENAISINIEDNGCGIPKDSLETIFSPFYTTKNDGTGLGLFMAYQIVAKHGGAILVESELGTGTIFKVYIPVSTTEQ